MTGDFSRQITNNAIKNTNIMLYQQTIFEQNITYTKTMPFGSLINSLSLGYFYKTKERRTSSYTWHKAAYNMGNPQRQIKFVEIKD